MSTFSFLTTSQTKHAKIINTAAEKWANWDKICTFSCFPISGVLFPVKMHNITAHNWMEIKYDIAFAPMPQFSSPQRNLKVEECVNFAAKDEENVRKS